LTNQAECLRHDDHHDEAAEAFAEAVDSLHQAALGSPEDRSRRAILLERQAHCEHAAGRYDAAADTRAEAVALRRESRGAFRPAELANALTEFAISCEEARRLPDALAAANEAVNIYGELYFPSPGRNWRDVARALVTCGRILVLLEKPVEAVAPFVNAITLARQAGDQQFASACKAGLQIALDMDPARADAELRRFLGI